ncbi:30S ribosomal protein S27ae [Candidatus Woesearchaeota archaeon]|nr:30S ribosomal protein S27ae [Candidatus Woesearchaeota archaeon]
MASPAQKSKGKTRQHYEIQGNRAVPKNQNCPKCGPGYILANHTDRVNCGKCGYTEYKKK